MLATAQEPRREKQEGSQESKHRLDRDADEAQWQGKQPHQGKQHQGQESGWPAKHEENAPAYQQDKRFHHTLYYPVSTAIAIPFPDAIPC